MTATFSPDLSDPISQVRQMIGDTDIVDGTEILDETINAYLGSLSVIRTAAQLCRDLAAKFAKRVTTGNNHQQQVNSDLYKHYMDLAATLEKRITKESANTDQGFCGIAAGIDGCKTIFNPDQTYGYAWEPGVGSPFSD